MPKENTIQTNFTAGEISPRLYGRIDIAKYRNGATTIENAQILPHGGATKRSGTVFAAAQRDSTNKARLHPFQFSTDESYVLCFENNIIRIFADGGLVTETPIAITNVSRSATALVTAPGHTYASGDAVVIASVGGMAELNNRQFTVGSTTGNDFYLTGIDSNAFTAYTSGGNVSKIIEINTDYTSSELNELRFAQSADTLYIAHKNHKLSKLTRSSNTDWSLSHVNPEDGPFRDINGDDTQKLFTSINSATVSVTAATQANPCVITTSTSHGFETGECVTFTSLGGMTQLNGNRYFIVKLNDTSFSLRDEAYRDLDSTSYSTYTSGCLLYTSDAADE